MNSTDLVSRTKQFALDIIHLTNSLPSDRATYVIAKQLMRCGTSVGANYRSASRARSRADFISKMGIVQEEADECVYWMELLSESRLVSSEKVGPLIKEAGEFVAISVSSIKTAKQNRSLTSK